MIRHRFFFNAIIALVMALIATPALAWPHAPATDWDLVARSELIVVGAIKDGSVVTQYHYSHDGSYSESQATLIVRQVLKGTCDQKEIPINLYYGLFPGLPGGKEPKPDPATGKAALPPGPIALSYNVDINIPVMADARQDAIWMLRRREGMYGEKPGHGDYGAVDSEDIQSISLKDYFTCYLTADPAAAMRALLQHDPAPAARATEYLDHVVIAKILTEPDAEVRASRLMPYVLTSLEAQFAIEDIGDRAGPYVLGTLQHTTDQADRQKLIRLLGKIKYDGATDALIAVLELNTRESASLTGPPDPHAAITPANNAAYHEWNDLGYQALNVIMALDGIGDPRARPAIESARQRWAALAPTEQNLAGSVVGACDRFLRTHAAVSK